MTNLRDAFRPTPKRPRWQIVAGAIAGAGIVAGGYMLGGYMFAPKERAWDCALSGHIAAEAVRVRNITNDPERARNILATRLSEQGTDVTEFIGLEITTHVADAFKAAAAPYNRQAQVELESEFAYRDAKRRCEEAYERAGE